MYNVGMEWGAYEGSLKGFTSGSEAPLLAGAKAREDGRLEARNMAGTDESV